MFKQLLIAGAAGLAVLSSGAAAQVKHATEDIVVSRSPEAGAQVFERKVMIAGAGTPGVEFVSGEMAIGGPVVKGAPYTADAINENTQTLSDGNRIVHRSSVAVARDSEGRTRRDMMIEPNSVDGPKFTFIHDPVADVSYTLNHKGKVARKMPGRSMAIHIEERSGEGEVKVRRAGPPSDVVMFPAHAAGPAPVFIRRGDAKDAKTESLGKQTIEGVVAEGTRSTVTIAAGEIGNERPIQVVTERWYSPELQTIVMSKHSDPRTGEMVYKLTNVRRAEPLRSLFEIPAGYTLKTDELPAPRIHMKE
jgi:hypothetical protein